MMLIVRRFEVRYGSGGGVVFDAGFESLGHRVRNFHARFEFEASMSIKSSEGFAEVRIEREVPLAKLPFKDGTNLERDSVRVELMLVEAEFGADAYLER